MITTDKKSFAVAMISCFQNYRANIAPEMIEDWFKSKLFGFPFFVVEKAFSEYVDNYKNKFPPQRGQIILLAYQIISGKKLEEVQKDGCSNLIVGVRCGEEIFIHSCCESCYDAKRPKNHTDQIRSERLRDWILKANEAGCWEEHDVAEWSKARMGVYALGQLVLGLESKNRETSQETA